jgi:hypothetical protein
MSIRSGCRTFAPRESSSGHDRGYRRVGVSAWQQLELSLTTDTGTGTLIVNADALTRRHADTLHHARRAIFLDRDGVINRPLIRAGKPY